MDAGSASTSGRRLPWALDAAILVAILVVSFLALTGPLHDYIFQQGFDDTYLVILPETAWAAAKVWAFWGAATVVVGGLLLRADPTLGHFDAALGGMVGVWVLSYLLANLLGPIGLFRATTIWALFALGAVWLWRVGPPRLAWHRPSPGQTLALLAFALLAPGMLVLQLGIPVPPYMDILATPSAAQRVLTFGRYLPFNNDPYGYWDAASQTPGTELLYAFLGFGTGTSLATLAATAAILPLALLLVFSTYRLGRSVGGDVMGGMAALFLFATVLFRIMPYMHGRQVTFPLVGLGLAFFLDERRNSTRLALSALILGTAIATHAIIGSFGMMVASLTIVFWLLSGDVVGALGGAVLLFGASLFAFPTLAINLRMPLPYPILPAVQIAGVGVIVLAARAMRGRPLVYRGPARWLSWILALVAIGLLVAHSPKTGVLVDDWQQFPILSIAAIAGFAVMLGIDIWRRWKVQLAPIVLGFLMGVGLDYVSRNWWTTFTDPKVQTAVEDFYHKVDYWNPYILLFPAACLFAWIYRVVSPRLAVFALVALLAYPWRDAAKFDPNYSQHSISDAYAFELQIAKNGYWGSTGHRRWAQSEAELEMADILRHEIAAGRIDLDTHVLVIEPHILLYQDNILLSLYTGINMDGYVAQYEFDRSIAGGRLRPISKLPEALAARPPYIVIHEHTHNLLNLYDHMPELPAESLAHYEELLNKGGVRLLRDRTLAPAAG